MMLFCLQGRRGTMPCRLFSLNSTVMEVVDKMDLMDAVDREW